MERAMVAILISLLVFFGISMTVGGVWFWGSTNTYALFVGGLAMLGWTALWSAPNLGKVACSLLMLISVICTGWGLSVEVVKDRDALTVWLLLFLVVLVSAAVWIRTKLLAWWV
jgi:hypothetical protein